MITPRPIQTTETEQVESPPSRNIERVVIIDTMLGGTGKHSRSQGEQVADLLRSDGIEVRTASDKASRLPRLADMLITLIRSRRWADVVSIAVFSGSAFWLADLASRMARWLGLPVVLVLHGGNLPSYTARHPNRVRSLLDRADIVVSPSAFNAQRLSGHHHGTIRVIGNVVDVDPDSWRPHTPPRPRIFWMRALHPIYGPEIAVEAMARVVRSHPEATLTMAGPDKASLEPAIRSRIAQLGLAEHVDLLGFLDRESKQRMFDDHDIYLNTSRVDNTPVTLLEAAAHGLAVVSTDAGGIPDLFADDENALLNPVDDADALATSICSLIDKPDRARRLTTQAHELVRSMTWQHLAPSWTKTFMDAVAIVEMRVQ